MPGALTWDPTPAGGAQSTARGSVNPTADGANAAALAIAAYGIEKSDVTVDICMPPYNARPGDDITTLVQALLNAMTPGVGLDIIISRRGTYNINGAQQTGAYVSNVLVTTVSGAQSLPAATINVASTAGWPPVGSASIDGQLVRYTGITSTTLTGCTGGTGTAANGGVAAYAYQYSGSVLIPYLAWNSGLATPLRIRGMPPIVSSGDSANGAAGGGVTLATTINSAGAYMFAAVPGFTKYGFAFGGVMPIFENLLFSHPSNPQGGSVNAETCLRAHFKNIVCDQGPIDWAANPPTGTTPAIILPQSKNNSNIVLDTVQIRSWGVALQISEHGDFRNLDISSSLVAFLCTAGGHTNQFGYVHADECATIFKLVGNSVSCIVAGSLDMENIASGTVLAPSVFADIVSSSSGLLGNLDLLCNPSGSLGLRGSGTLNMRLNNVAEPRQFIHPVDTMQRLASVALPSGSAPGISWPTLDPWKVINGSFQLTAGAALQSTNSGGSAQAGMPVRDGLLGGESRRVQMTVTLAASGTYDVSIFGHRQQSTTLSTWIRLTGTNLTFTIGNTPSVAALYTAAGVVANGGTYTIALDLIISNGLLMGVNVYLGGVLKYSHACSAAQQYTGSASAPYLYDGVYLSETSPNYSSVTAFRVLPIAAPAASLASGTATLVAGTVAVAYPNITANSIVRLSRQAAGGTLGAMSVALTAGTGFTINSNSGSDTSTVFWEIVTV